jgi:hypothetical protein
MANVNDQIRDLCRSLNEMGRLVAVQCRKIDELEERIAFQHRRIQHLERFDLLAADPGSPIYFH